MNRSAQQGRTGRTGFRTGRNGDLVAVLDIGCSKIGCLIARAEGPGPSDIRLIGGGHQSSRGFEAGSITDMDALERAIRLAVESAEHQAGEAISDLVVGISAPQVTARLVRGEIDIGGRDVTPRDVRKVQTAAMERFVSSAEALRDHEILAATPVAYAIEGADGVRDPVGMYTSRLGVLINVVHVPHVVVRNLRQCIERAHLNVATFVPSATASALGTLIEDELEHGAICIDLGAGVSAVSVFLNGMPAWFGRVAVGGAHITRDISQCLGTTVAAAERVKTVYGHAETEGPNHREMIECPRLGDDGRLAAAEMSRNELARIIAPRVEEVFELIRARMDAAPIRSVLPRRIVLTGGGSQLSGVKEVAARVLSRPVRLARPVEAEKIGEIFANPAFSTAAGLLAYAMAGLPDAGRGGAARLKKGSHDTGGVMTKAMGWLRDNF